MRKWVSKCGSIELYNGDCLETSKQLEAGTIAAVVTDPPYSSGARREADKGKKKSMTRSVDASKWFGTDCLTTTGFIWLMRNLAIEAKRLLIPGGHLLSFIDWRMYPNLGAAIESADLRAVGLIVWDKDCIGMGTHFRNQHEFVLHFSNGTTRPTLRKNVANVLRCKRVRNGQHPTEKPAELLRRLIEVVTNPGEVVFDPFAGSASCALACLQTGRRFVGIEADPDIYAAAVERLELLEEPARLEYAAALKSAA